MAGLKQSPIKSMISAQAVPMGCTRYRLRQWQRPLYQDLAGGRRQDIFLIFRSISCRRPFFVSQIIYSKPICIKAEDTKWSCSEIPNDCCCLYPFFSAPYFRQTGTVCKCTQPLFCVLRRDTLCLYKQAGCA